METGRQSFVGRAPDWADPHLVTTDIDRQLRRPVPLRSPRPPAAGVGRDTSRLTPCRVSAGFNQNPGILGFSGKIKSSPELCFTGHSMTFKFHVEV